MSILDVIAGQNLSSGNSDLAFQMLKMKAENNRADLAASVATRGQDVAAQTARGEQEVRTRGQDVDVVQAQQKNALDLYNANQDRGIKQQEADTGRMNVGVGQQNANTNAFTSQVNAQNVQSEMAKRAADIENDKLGTQLKEGAFKLDATKFALEEQKKQLIGKGFESGGLDGGMKALLAAGDVDGAMKVREGMQNAATWMQKNQAINDSVRILQGVAQIASITDPKKKDEYARSFLDGEGITIKSGEDPLSTIAALSQANQLKVGREGAADPEALQKAIQLNRDGYIPPGSNTIINTGSGTVTAGQNPKLQGNQSEDQAYATEANKSQAQATLTAYDTVERLVEQAIKINNAHPGASTLPGEIYKNASDIYDKATGKGDLPGAQQLSAAQHKLAGNSVAATAQLLAAVQGSAKRLPEGLKTQIMHLMPTKEDGPSEKNDKLNAILSLARAQKEAALPGVRKGTVTTSATIKSAKDLNSVEEVDAAIAQELAKMKTSSSEQGSQ